MLKRALLEREHMVVSLKDRPCIEVCFCCRLKGLRCGLQNLESVQIIFYYYLSVVAVAHHCNLLSSEDSLLSRSFKEFMLSETGKA